MIQPTTPTGGDRLPPRRVGLHRPVRRTGVYGPDAPEVPRGGAGQGGQCDVMNVY